MMTRNEREFCVLLVVMVALAFVLALLGCEPVPAPSPLDRACDRAAASQCIHLRENQWTVLPGYWECKAEKLKACLR